MRLAINWRGLAALLSVSLALLGCNAGPINVGFIGPLTGRYADLGVAGRDGALLAVEQINQSGGINGHLLVLQEFDDQQRPETLSDFKPKMQALKLSGVVGPMTSSVAERWIPIANDMQLVSISPTVTSENFSKLDDYFFTVTSNTAEYATFSASYYVQKAGLKQFSLVLDVANSAYSKSWSKHFRNQVEALGGRILSEMEFRSGDNVGLKNALNQAIAPGPDGLVFVASAPDVAQLAQLTRTQDRHLPIMAAEWAGSESVWKIVGSGLNGIRFSQFINVRDSGDKSIHFRNQFNARFGRFPGFAEFAAFDAMHTLISAISQKAPTEPLKNALLRVRNFEGIQNQIHFDENGDAKRPIYMVELNDGEIKVLQ